MGRHRGHNLRIDRGQSAYLCAEPELLGELQEDLRVRALQIHRHRYSEPRGYHSHHGHTMDGLLLPGWERRVELHVVVLQDTETERTECVVRVERIATRKGNLDSPL